MPRNNYEPAVTPGDPALEDRLCPKCGAVMEPIERQVEGLPLEHLQLCPGCYLVMWRGPDGFQVRQGVPMKQGVPAENVPAEDIPDPEAC